MSLRVEVLKNDQWITSKEIVPGGIPGSISDNSNGRREVYILNCAPDNSKSTIFVPKLEVDVKEGAVRRIAMDLDEADIIKTLGVDESYVMTVVTDRSNSPKKVRITHTTSK